MNTLILSQSINYNNRGVLCLRDGSLYNALLNFKHAAQGMYTITQHMKSSVGCSHFELEQSSTICAPTLEAIDTGDLFLCSHPIVMLEDPSATKKGSIRQCTVESCICLFNMALTYHLDALRAATMEGALHNAASLYEMAFNLGLQVQEDIRISRVIMSALNNLGHIHHWLGDYAISRAFLDDLSLYIHSLSYPVHCEQEVALRNDFMLNAMILREPQLAAAA